MLWRDNMPGGQVVADDRSWRRCASLLCALVCGFGADACALAGAPPVFETPYAWRSNDPYVAPAFESFFPDDQEGGKQLDSLWNDRRKEHRNDAEILVVVRNGLRHTRQHRTLILRWIGNKYIWGQKQQNADAIELMYHATDGDKYGTRHYAVYFGLSVVNKKTPAVLHALADLCIRVDDPNDLERVAWGCRSQREELLKYIQPYLESADPEIRAKAVTVDKICRGELKAFQWAAERAKEKAAAEFGQRLPEIRQQLQVGDTAVRKEVLRTIQTNRLAAIMDESFLDAFAACAGDEDRNVRSAVARIVGGNWVWSAQNQSPKAIAIALQLARDPVREVRYEAVYHGLSTVREKSDAVIGRLLELAYEDRERNLFGRICWGLQRDRAAAKRLLDAAVERWEDDPKTAVAAFQIYRDVVGQPAPHADRFAPLETRYGGDHRILLVFAATTGAAKTEPAAFRVAIAKSLDAPELRALADELTVSDDQPTLVGMLVLKSVVTRDRVVAAFEDSGTLRVVSSLWTDAEHVRRWRARNVAPR